MSILNTQQNRSSTTSSSTAKSKEVLQGDLIEELYHTFKELMMLISRHGNTKKEIKDGFEKSTYILEHIQVRRRANSMERKRLRQYTPSPELSTLSNEKKKAKTGGHSRVSFVVPPSMGANMGTPSMDRRPPVGPSLPGSGDQRQWEERNESRMGASPKLDPLLLEHELGRADSIHSWLIRTSDNKSEIVKGERTRTIGPYRPLENPRGK